MKSVSDHVRAWAEGIKDALRLLSQHSAIEKRFLGDSELVILTGYDYEWSGLDDAGRRMQAKILEEYRRFSALLRTLLAEQTDDTLEELSEADQGVLEVIQQQGPTDSQWVEQAFEEAYLSIDRQTGLLDRLRDGSEEEAVFVPDTNALIHNPALEAWRFAGCPRFTLLLLPTVLKELDALKVNHRNEDVRRKAERLISQFKEYRRRGRLTDGVPLLKGRIDIASVATEPRFGDALTWLDPANEDDRLLASVIEVMRRRPHSAVTLVTRDINLQNKAEFARVPYAEPPDPMPDPARRTGETPAGR